MNGENREQWPWLEDLGKPSVGLRPRPEESYILDSTRIGGVPLLAEGVRWPGNHRGERLVFVAQLRRDDFLFLPFPEQAGWLQLYWDRHFPFDLETEY